jgi:hypothetical protein
MRITFLLITLLILASCQKEKLKLSKDSPLIGDYEWMYSEEFVWTEITLENFPDMIDVSETSDRYGFRIKRNGKVYFFKNGKLDFEGRLTAIPEEGYPATTIKARGMTFYLYVYKDAFSLGSYPFEDYRNVYTK